MAIKREDLAELPPSRKRGAPAKYDWPALFDGGVWELEEGVDFSKITSFRPYASARAALHGLKVHVHRAVDSDTKYLLQAYNPEGN